MPMLIDHYRLVKVFQGSGYHRIGMPHHPNTLKTCNRRIRNQTNQELLSNIPLFMLYAKLLILMSIAVRCLIDMNISP